MDYVATVGVCLLVLCVLWLAGLALSAKGRMRTVESVVDELVTGLRDGSIVLGDEPPTEETVTPSRTLLRVGPFECDLDAMGYGAISLDGKRVLVYGFTLVVEAGDVPRLTIRPCLHSIAKDA